MKPFHQGKQRLRLIRRDNLDYPIHLHDAIEIVFVLEGESTALCENRTIRLSPGDLFVAFPNRIHGYIDSSGISAYVLICPADFILSSLGESLDKKSPRNPCTPLMPGEDDSIPLLLDLAFRDWQKGEKAIKEGYTSVLLSKILSLFTFQEEEHFSSALSVALGYINEHYKEGITRKKVADAIGYHESYLSHLFCESLGKSFSDYVLSLRLADATELLDQTDEAISTIALSLGFGSIRSFNRAFLKTMHTSPSAYRLQKRKT